MVHPHLRGEETHSDDRVPEAGGGAATDHCGDPKEIRRVEREARRQAVNVCEARDPMAEALFVGVALDLIRGRRPDGDCAHLGTSWLSCSTFLGPKRR